MDESKRKQLETQLRQLISAAANPAKAERQDSRYVNGRVQVIRRRKEDQTALLWMHRPQRSRPTLNASAADRLLSALNTLQKNNLTHSVKQRHM